MRTRCACLANVLILLSFSTVWNDEIAFEVQIVNYKERFS